ncbi:DedA family protein [Actinomadura keratinilytica]|jgi:membrane protein DedA with SNARE-associated domain|uniref:VTT domain-containing protein n=1 Tax=Actinomadura keratinilytica TaxID=547461 RepID=A0ABP7XXC7_9ACTN
MTQHFSALVDGLPPLPVYLLVAGLVFAEAALFFGFVFPGETAIVVGGVLASQGRLSLAVLLPIAIAAAIAGDSVGYEIGRRYGDRLLDTRATRRHRPAVGRAQDLIRRRGAFAVFLGRFTALLRALMPALAGSARMPYARFLVFNTLGGICWVGVFTFGGFFTGAAFEHMAKVAGRGLAIALAAVALAALAVWAWRRRRGETRTEKEAEGVADALTAEAAAVDGASDGSRGGR